MRMVLHAWQHLCDNIYVTTFMCSVLIPRVILKQGGATGASLDKDWPHLP